MNNNESIPPVGWSPFKAQRDLDAMQITDDIQALAKEVKKINATLQALVENVDKVDEYVRDTVGHNAYLAAERVSKLESVVREIKVQTMNPSQFVIEKLKRRDVLNHLKLVGCSVRAINCVTNSYPNLNNIVRFVDKLPADLSPNYFSGKLRNCGRVSSVELVEIFSKVKAFVNALREVDSFDGVAGVLYKHLPLIKDNDGYWDGDSVDSISEAKMTVMFYYGRRHMSGHE